MNKENNDNTIFDLTEMPEFIGFPEIYDDILLARNLSKNVDYASIPSYSKVMYTRDGLVCLRFGEPSNGKLYEFSLDGTRFNIVHPFLNTYALADSSISQALGWLLPGYKPHDYSVEQEIAMFSNYFGYFQLKPLEDLLGISSLYYRKMISRAVKHHLMDSFKHHKTNYRSNIFYINRGSTVHELLADTPRPLYAGSRNKKKAALIPHSVETYHCILNALLYARYYNAPIQYQVEHGYSQGKTELLNKSNSIVFSDATLYIEETHQIKELIVEQDMGTEPVSKLIQKLSSYYDADVLTKNTSDSKILLFCCHKQVKQPSKQNVPVQCYEAFYVLFHAYYKAFIKTHSNLSGIEHLNIMKIAETPALLAFFITKDVTDEIPDALSSAKSNAAFTIGTDSATLLEHINLLLQEFQASLQVYQTSGTLPLSPFFQTIYLLFGCIDYNNNKNATFLRFETFQNFVHNMKHLPDGFEGLLSFHRSMEDLAYKRYLSIGKMLLAKQVHSNFSARDLSFLMYGGSFYVTSTDILSSFLPYILWNRQSKEVILIEKKLQFYFGDIITYNRFMEFDYRTTASTLQNHQQNEMIPTCYFKNHYCFQNHCNVCVEYLSKDVSVILRFYYYLLYCMNNYSGIKLILLVDSISIAKQIFQNFYFHNLFSCKNNSLNFNFNHDKNFFKTSFSDFAFLEIGNSYFHQMKLFKIHPDNLQIFYL